MDRYTIETLGVPGETLMRRAATGAFRQGQRMLQGSRGPVVVLAGSGNNGGDGIGMAALFREAGYLVTCYMVGNREKLTADGRAMVTWLESVGGTLLDLPEGDWLPEDCALLVDALFGTGLSRPIGGRYRAVIETMNRSGVPILACDIPSGISADTGEVLGCAVRAQVTVTFNLPKTGQLLPPGTEYTGRLVVQDIGIPQEAKDQVTFDGEYLTEDLVRSWLPTAALESHKGDFGKLLLLCGSTGFTGAATLAAKGALRTGAGLVYLGVPESVYPIVAGKLEEPVVFPLPANAQGQFAEGALPQLQDRIQDMDACLVGPGMGNSQSTQALVFRLLETATCPLVLDADGINVLSGHIDRLDKAQCPVVLTPHEGEFRRLGGDTSLGRLAGTRALAEKTGAVVVRKGYRTVVAGPQGEIYVNSTGNPGMATGGSGDVLSGILTCLLGQGMAPVQAAAAAVWLHGAAGDLCQKRLGTRSMLPSDMIGALSDILK
jgi:NAD(P)H-hydrate epimerase